VGCADAGADTYAAGLQKSGSEGHYGFELVSSTPAPPALNDNTFVMQVKDAEGKPVAGELSVVLEMPEHGHRSQQPVITFDADAQTFTLDPMRLFMVGLWRLTFGFQPGAAAAKTAPDPDSAVFEFCLD
jgi:hypothetical protein